MQIINKNINELIQYDNNPRRNDESVEYVANSIREFGFRVPILVDSNNVIISGHTRLKAAMLLGMDEVPVIVEDDMTEEQVKDFRIADNKAGESSEWNFFKLSAEMAELDAMDMTDFGFDENEIEGILGLANDLASNTEQYFHYERNNGMLPIVVLKKSPNERMASTVRHNRARGKHSVSGMSNLVFRMLDNGWSDEEICNEMGMEAEELLRLKHITGFSKLFEDAEYKQAWESKRQIRLKKLYEEHPELSAKELNKIVSAEK